MKPASGVRETMENLKAQRDFKRRLIFSLRSLSESCGITNRQFMENVKGSLDIGLMDELVGILGKYPDDVEIISFVAIVIQGIVRTLVLQPECDRRDIDIGEIILNVLIPGLLAGEPDPAAAVVADSVWRVVYLTLKDYSLLTEMKPSATILTALEKKMSTIDFTPAMGCVAMEMTKQMKLAQFDDSLCLILERCSKSRDETLMREAIKRVEQNIKEASLKNTSRVMCALIKLLEGGQTSRDISAGGCRILKALIERNTTDLEGVPLISLLTILSDDGDLIQQIMDFQPDGLGFLVECLSKSSNPGTCRPMLRVVAKMAEKRAAELVRNHGILPVLCEMLENIESDPRLVSNPEEKTQISGCILKLVSILGDNTKCTSVSDTRVTTAAMRILQHKRTNKTLSENDKIQLASALSYLRSITDLGQRLDDAIIAEVILISRVLLLPDGILILDKVPDRSWLEKIVDAVDLIDDESAAESLIKLISRDELSASTTEIILKLGMKFKDNAYIRDGIRRILNKSGSIKDVQKGVKLLKNNEINVALALLTGLSTVERLKEAFVDNLVIENLLKAIDHMLINHAAPKYKLIYQFVVKGLFECILSVERLTNSESALDRMLAVCNSRKMKTVVDKQSNENDSSIVDGMRCCKEVSHRSRSSASKTLEHCGSIMRKYSDTRKVQILAMSIIYDIIDRDDGNQFIKSGLAKQIVNYLMKALHHEDIQILGLRIIREYLPKKSPEYVSVFKDYKLVEALKMTHRTHGNCDEIRKLYNDLMAIMSPGEFGEAEVSRWIKSLNIGIKNNDREILLESLKRLSELTTLSDSCKYAVKNNLVERMISYTKKSDICVDLVERILVNISKTGKPYTAMAIKNGLLDLIFDLADNGGSPTIIVECLRQLALDSARIDVHNSSKILTLVERIEKQSSVYPILALIGCLTTKFADDEFLRVKLSTAIKDIPDKPVYELRCLSQMFNCRNVEVMKCITKTFLELDGNDVLIQIMQSGDNICTELCREIMSKLYRTNNSSISIGGKKVARTFGRNLCSNVDDCKAILSNLALMRHVNVDIQDIEGMFGVINDMIDIHIDDDRLASAVQRLVQNVIDVNEIDYFREIVELLLHQPDDYLVRVESHLFKLNVLLVGESNTDRASKDTDRASKDVDLGHAAEAVNLLAKHLWRLGSEGLTSTLKVCHRLVNKDQKFRDTVQGDMMDRIIKLVQDPSTAGSISSNGTATKYIYVILDDLILHEKSAKFRVIENRFLIDTWRLLDIYVRDERISAQIIKFLGHFTDDSDTLREVDECYAEATKSMRNVKSNHADCAIFDIIWGYRRSANRASIDAALQSVGHFVRVKGVENKLIDCKEHWPKFDDFIGDKTTVMSFADMLISISKSVDSTILSDKCLESMLKLWYDEIQFSEDEIYKKNFYDSIVRLTRENLNCNNIVKKALLTLSEFPDISHDELILLFGESVEDCHSIWMTNFVPNVLIKSKNFKGEFAKNFIETIIKLVKLDSSRINYVNVIPNILEKLDSLQTDPISHGAAKELRLLLENISELTLEQIYAKWSHSVENDIDINCEFSYMYELCRKYGAMPHLTVKDSHTREFLFGCLDFALIYKCHKNFDFFIQNSVPQFFMKCLETNSKLEEVTQYIVNNNISFVEQSGRYWGEIEKSNLICINSCLSKKSIKWVIQDPVQRELMLVKRLEFLEYLIYKQDFLNGTNILAILMDIWLLVDQKMFPSNKLQSRVIRILRLIINDHHWTDQITDVHLIDKLLDKIHNLEDYQPDLLYCVGIMAANPPLKQILSDQHVVLKIVELLKISNDYSKIQQNACLALGNLVLGHGSNANCFGNAKGIELVIGIMRSAMFKKTDYDLSNALSVLMCNLSFKRDDFKEVLGDKGAPDAILLTINKYSIAADAKTTNRCLNSMFKGIANLALIPNNVQRFLDAGIIQSLDKFYGENPPNDLILISLKTLTNLTLENAQEYLQEFGTLISSLLKIIQTEQRLNPGLLAFMFETFASLCRLEDNRKAFMKHGGIPTVIEYLQMLSNDAMYEQGLSLMSVLSFNEKAAEAMIEAKIFTFVLSLIDQQDSSGACFPSQAGGRSPRCYNISQSTAPPVYKLETIIAGLKVIRRLIRRKPASQIFIDLDPVPVIAELVIEASECGLDHLAASIITLECLKIIATLLTNNPPPYLDEVDSDEPVVISPPWSKKGSSVTTASKGFARIFQRDNTNILSSVGRSISPGSYIGSPVDLNETPIHKLSGQPPTLCKPRGPRSYEIIGFDCKLATHLATALVLMLVSTNSRNFRVDKLTELTLGILAYFVIEKVDGVNLAFSGADHLELFILKGFGHRKDSAVGKRDNLISTCALILANLLPLTTEDQLTNLAEIEEVIASIKSASSHQRNGPTKKLLDEIYALLHTDAPELSPSVFAHLLTYNYDWNDIDFQTDKYPNGVQDLNSQIRKKIRKGGKCQILKVEDGTALLLPCWWKASTDMTDLQYMTDNQKQNYNFKIPFAKVRKIEKGFKGVPSLEQYADLFRRKRLSNTHKLLSTVELVCRPKCCFGHKRI